VQNAGFDFVASNRQTVDGFDQRKHAGRVSRFLIRRPVLLDPLARDSAFLFMQRQLGVGWAPVDRRT
jgi:hypothetical protein